MLAADFQEAAALLKKLNEHGFEACIVGGAVRNHLIGKPIEDIDIATSAKPEQVQQLFAKTIPVGLEHGTVVVRYRHRSYEVTTFRAEADYEDHRRPSSVSFVASLEEDLKRRDFTINALAMSGDGTLVDLFGGREDLKARIIRTVGQARDRFQEDPLRMMRAVRFASQLSFEIDEKTEKALEKSAGDLRYISVERVTVEFEKLLLGESTAAAFSTLVSSGLYAYLPGMNNYREELLEIANVDLSPLKQLAERWAFIAARFQIEPLSPWLRQWKLSNHKINEVTAIVEALHRVDKGEWTRCLVYETGLEKALAAERVRSVLNQSEDNQDAIRSIYEQLPIKSRRELRVNGNDLIEWSQKRSGPWIAAQLEAVERAVLAAKIGNDREEIRTWLEKQTF